MESDLRRWTLVRGTWSQCVLHHSTIWYDIIRFIAPLEVRVQVILGSSLGSFWVHCMLGEGKVGRLHGISFDGMGDSGPVSHHNACRASKPLEVDT